MSSIIDPNIEFAASSTFKAGLPMKNWFDRRARLENAPDDFIYHVYTKDGKKKRFIVDRDTAALINTPTSTDIQMAKDAGVILISGPEAPHRELAPDETLVFDPFGQIIVRKNTDIVDNSELIRLVREIHAKIIG